MFRGGTVVAPALVVFVVLAVPALGTGAKAAAVVVGASRALVAVEAMLDVVKGTVTNVVLVLAELGELPLEHPAVMSTPMIRDSVATRSITVIASSERTHVEVRHVVCHAPHGLLCDAAFSSSRGAAST
jgi:hypothetical protein